MSKAILGCVCVVFAAWVTAGCGGPPTSIDAGNLSDGGGVEVPDAGQQGTGLAPGSFCTSAGTEHTCYGSSARAVMMGPNDAGFRPINAIGSFLGRGTQIKLLAPFEVATATSLTGTMIYTRFSCADVICPVACAYGSGDGGEVQLSGTLYRFDSAELELELHADNVSPSHNADGGCPTLSLSSKMRLRN